MLVDNSVYKNSYTGTGTTTEFPITFPFLENKHIQVIQSTDNGITESEVPSSDYTISGAGLESGGTCTFKVAPQAGVLIIIRRNVPITQLYAYKELDNFPAESHENALAKLTMIDQQQQEQINRALKVSGASQQSPEELLNELFQIRDDSEAAQSAAEAAQSAAEDCRDTACECASQAQNTLDSAVQVIQNQESISKNAVIAQEQASVSVVQSEGDTQAKRLEDIATTILVSAASYNKSVSVKLTSAITSGETYTLPESLAYLVGRSQLLVSGNGVWFYKGFQYEEVGTDGVASTQITFLQDLAIDDVLTFTILANRVNVLTTTNSGLINDADGHLKLNVDGQTVLINASGQVYVPVMVGATASADGKSGNVPAPNAGQQEFFLRGDGTWAVAAGLPLGHFFAWPFSTPPDGSIVVNGATYSRTLYADLWSYISSKSDWVKTESEWQSIASANNGYCPYYSDGDGSTTFRVPKFAPYQKIALASGDAGKYHEAGLPNTTGFFSATVPGNHAYSAQGVFSGADHPAGSLGPLQYRPGGDVDPNSPIYGYDFSLSKASPIYGKSTTVQPESNEWIICVVAYGRATNVGSADVADVMSAVGTVQAEISDVLNKIMPVGSVYVQFPGCPAPADIFGGTWANISSNHPGAFFRLEGGDAAEFGSWQQDGAPDIVGSFGRPNRNGFEPVWGAFYAGAAIGGYARDDARDSQYVDFAASRSNSKYGSATEVRPLNITVRLWQRTA